MNDKNSLRIDKFLSDSLGMSRKDANKLVRSKNVYINDELALNASQKVILTDKIRVGEDLIQNESFEYNFLIFNKPAGTVCAHNELYSVYDQLPPAYRKFHSVGRLDKDTTGLLFFTSDGQVSHRLTSPKHKVPKTYRVWLADPVEDYYQQEFAQGIMLHGNSEPTLPATLVIIDDYCVDLTIHEGQYHQVKRMFGALGNKVEALHRYKIGNYVLPEDLPEGEFIELTVEEALKLIY